MFKSSNKPKLRVFFSHSNQDADVVQHIADLLKQQNVSAWTYETSLLFGDKVVGKVRQAIYDCDLFIVVASKPGLASTWVARETWLAEHLLKERGNHSPRIITYVPLQKDADAAELRLNLRHFETGEPTGQVRDLSEERCFAAANAHTDRLSELFALLTPKVRIYGKHFEDSEELRETGVFDVYEKLFPDPLQRADLDNILTFLFEQTYERPQGALTRMISKLTRGFNRKADSNWASLFATMEVAGRAVGFVYVSVHKPTGWAFGNYFGLLECWRPYSRAKWFLDETIKDLKQTLPNTHGIVFEVDPFEPKPVGELLNKLRAAPLAADLAAEARRTFLTEEEVRLIKAIRRVRLYHRHGGRIVLDKQNKPLWYRQPPLEIPASTSEALQDKECPLWLMVYKLSDKSKYDDIETLLKVVYFELFGALYSQIFVQQGFDYMAYLRDRYARSLAAAAPGKIAIGKAYTKNESDLVQIAEDKGFNVHL